MSSKRPALARVFWIHLLEICWTFARSCKHPITFTNLTLLVQQFVATVSVLVTFLARLTDVPLIINSAVFTRGSRMLRASSPWSGRLSVRPSVTLVICIKTVQARITNHEIFTVGCPKVSSLSWQNFVPLGAGVPLERGRRRGVSPWKTSFCRYWLE